MATLTADKLFTIQQQVWSTMFDEDGNIITPDFPTEQIPVTEMERQIAEDNAIQQIIDGNNEQIAYYLQRIEMLEVENAKYRKELKK